MDLRSNSDSIQKWRNFRISRTCHRTTNHAHCSTKNFNRCAVVIEIYFMFMILCLCSKSIYTLASTAACRSDRTILFEEPGESAHLCLPVIIIITRKRLHPNSNRSRRFNSWFDSNENFRFAVPYMLVLHIVIQVTCIFIQIFLHFLLFCYHSACYLIRFCTYVCGTDDANAFQVL